ncbi:MAG TPA: AMP-binding protein [Vicinamibacterales bacterium]|nr:AMP-binding protein [Vicinamibacterales bacterium]
MRRETLLDFFHDFAQLNQPFLVHDDGYRVREYSYAEVGSLARAFAGRLRVEGLRKGDALVVWSENRPEWIVGMWGALLEGVVLVPVDYRVSADFLWRVQQKTSARVILAGDSMRLDDHRPGVAVWRMRELAAEGAAAAAAARAERNGAEPADAGAIAEIIFTSGATAEPKGVVITHRNVLANIVPIEREMRKYRRYIRLVSPVRFLNLLPLSHMFGQAMATFIPPMMPGVVIFSQSYNPEEIVRQIRSRRVSVLVCVPKVLEVMKEHVSRVFPDAATPHAGRMHWAKRWWVYRRVHRAFGIKFWAFVVGAAPLDPALEEYWTRLGFAVVQGYGLTETAPIVTLNHPLKARRGTVGSPIAGVEVRIAEDGEILVRGENVTAGYYNAPAETAAAFEDGWLHTGDIGAMDESGRLTIKGRKKEMIVTPEGLNVFPEDVERALNGQPGVRESAVVGVSAGAAREERVHAVLVLEHGTDADAVIRGANARLEDHQRVRSFSAWPGDALPRTEGTGKLRRKEIQRWVGGGAPAAAPRHTGRAASAADVVSRFARERTVAPDTTIEELGLSSLERVELMMAMEEAFDVTIDEARFADARTIADLDALVRGEREQGPAEAGEGPVEAGRFGEGAIKARPQGEGAAESGRHAEAIEFPRWNRRLPARALRRASLPTWILPVARAFAWTHVEGLEHLEHLRGPAIFAANHQSHMDVPVILWSLPARWRYRVAPAMAKEFFKAHFFPAQHTRRQWFTNSLNYYLAALFFNAFPLPQREAGTRQTLRYAGELVSGGYSILIFPEGRRTQGGEIAPFRPGVGIMASRLNVPVVPVRLEGVDKVLHQTWKLARPGRVRVAFGPPLQLEGEDYAALARQVEETVRAL